MGDNQAIARILYLTIKTPVDLNGMADLKQAKENEVRIFDFSFWFHLTCAIQPPLHYNNGTIVRMVDFAPGAASPLHRIVALIYSTVLEGEFELTLDSGEKTILRQGDVTILRGAA